MTRALGAPRARCLRSGGVRFPREPPGSPGPPEFEVLSLLVPSPSRVPHYHAVLGDLLPACSKVPPSPGVWGTLLAPSETVQP